MILIQFKAGFSRVIWSDAEKHSTQKSINVSGTSNLTLNRERPFSASQTHFAALNMLREISSSLIGRNSDSASALLHIYFCTSKVIYVQ